MRNATEAAGVRDLHFHDLRHTGNTWAAESGATLRYLMDRMGHSTTRAALIYLHKRAGRDKKIAGALSDLVKRSRKSNDDGADGPGEDEPEDTDGPEGHAGGTPAQ